MIENKINNTDEKSCGAIIYRNKNNQTEYLLLFQHNSKTWSFPKGHTEIHEDEKQTALREIMEETGLQVELIDGFRESIKYTLSNNRIKKVVLFIAEVDDEITLQQSEIEKFIWADKQTAIKLLTHKGYAEILDNAEKIARNEQ